MASSLRLLSPFLLVSFFSLIVSANTFPRYFPTKAIQQASILSQYAIPLSNGSMDLPSPPAGTSLQILTIGRGTQNYTCAANGSASSAPKSTGAIATLYDAAYLLAAVPPSNAHRSLDDLPRQLLAYSRDTLATAGLPVLGHHYFNAAAVPTFSMNVTGATAAGNSSDHGSGVLAGKKIGDITAPPASAKPNVNGNGPGAVDWLALSAGNGSIGLAQAYRVVTAGGKAPATCEGQPATIEVEYAAQYWFFA